MCPLPVPGWSQALVITTALGLAFSPATTLAQTVTPAPETAPVIEAPTSAPPTRKKSPGLAVALPIVTTAAMATASTWMVEHSAPETAIAAWGITLVAAPGVGQLYAGNYREAGISAAIRAIGVPVFLYAAVDGVDIFGPPQTREPENVVMLLLGGTMTVGSVVFDLVYPYWTLSAPREGSVTTQVVPSLLLLGARPEDGVTPGLMVSGTF